jgi:adenylate kinase family enzyme
MDREKLIIINGYPNTLRKIEIVERQLNYLKKLGYPILFVSGCNVPSSILDQVDYFILNTNNEPLRKDFTYNLFTLGHWEAAHVYIDFANYNLDFYSDIPNNIITENIKLGFNLAKTLGYKSVFYTEDDNIFKDESFNSVKDKLNLIQENKYKVITVLGHQVGSTFKIAFTTFFFANVDFIIENFNIPTKKEDWYNPEIITQYSLHKTYEGIFYDLLKDKLDLVLNIEPEFVELHKQDYIEWGIVNRYQNEKYLIDNYFTILPHVDGTKHLVLFNWSSYLVDGLKPYNIKIHFDDNLVAEPYLATAGCWYVCLVPEEVQQVTLDIDGYGQKVLETSWDVIKYNGLLKIE